MTKQGIFDAKRIVAAFANQMNRKHTISSSYMDNVAGIAVNSKENNALIGKTKKYECVCAIFLSNDTFIVIDYNGDLVTIVTQMVIIMNMMNQKSKPSRSVRVHWDIDTATITTPEIGNVSEILAEECTGFGGSIL